MNKATIENSRIFISYSWTTPDYEQQVVSLAEKLVEMGVDVVLDKWDLVEGADVNAYMEKMVTDESINKVLVLCDKAYADKADGRKGGVGTETLIITPKIYGQANPASKNQRFIPVIMERDEQGQACCPTFISGRSYIDMSSPDCFDKGFEQLLRTIYNKPVFKKPELGKTPAFLLKDEVISLGSSAKHRVALHAVQEGKANALGACRDYFDTVIENMERFRVGNEGEGEFDDRIVQSIEMLEEPKNELVEFFTALIRYLPAQQTGETLRRFFERVYPYTQWPENLSQWNKDYADNYRFFLHELFLCAVAIALKEEKFTVIPELLQDFYYLDRRISSSSMCPYTRYRSYLNSIDRIRNMRTSAKRLSLHADMLKQRADMCPHANFENIMQADFFLFLYSQLHKTDDWGWYPTSLLYAAWHHAPFEIFLRSQSTKYFEKMKEALEVENKESLIDLCDKFSRNELEAPRWGGDSISPRHLAAVDTIATRP